MEPSSSIPGNAVHIWYTLAPTNLAATELDEVLAARYRPLLTPDEQARHRRFVQAKDRCQYLLGKVLVRTALSHYLPGGPEFWLFTANRYGKPVLSNSPALPAPCFNLAHTEGLVACVLAREFDVGIDVERRARSANLDIALRFFAEAEVAFLERLPESERQRAFFVFWTLKEAYVKARGMGLSLPLEQFAFGLEGPQAPTITFDAAMKDDPANWRFLLPAVPSPAHQVAVAVRCPPSTNLD